MGIDLAELEDLLERMIYLEFETDYYSIVPLEEMDIYFVLKANKHEVV